MSTEGSEKKISVNVGLTVNLGDYNSLRIDAGSEVPGDPDNKKDWERLWEAVYAELFEQIDESSHVKEALRGE